MGSFDGGAEWSPVYSRPIGEGWLYLGFTTARQGVAIDGDGTILMTFDGGHDWEPAQFPATSS